MLRAEGRGQASTWLDLESGIARVTLLTGCKLGYQQLANLAEHPSRMASQIAYPVDDLASPCSMHGPI